MISSSLATTRILTLEGAFRRFAATYVDLPSVQVQTARSSRDFLIQALSGMRDPGHVPRLTGRVYPFGSFARRTKIRPLDDIDLLVELDGNGLALPWSFFGGPSRLQVNRSVWPAAFITPDGHLNSTVVVNALGRYLSRIPQYQATPRARNGQALVLRPVRHPWSFDLVPAFAVKDRQGRIEHYLIPDGKGGWMKTDPRQDALLTRQVSQKLNGQLALTRLVKYWNRRPTQPRLGSYHVEAIMAEVLGGQVFQPEHTAEMLHYAFAGLASRVTRPFPDPKRLGGPIDTSLTWQQRQVVSRAATLAATALRAASQTYTSSPREALIHIRRVFGANFPAWQPR